jgi:antirestriction protein ArdC
MGNETARLDVYGIVTERIVARLEKGVVPWRRPWAGGGLPKNGVTRKEYRGVNVLLLGCQQYASPYWMSFKQVKERGGSVLRDEKASPCVYWNWMEIEDLDADGKPKKIPFLKYYNVFNTQQTTLADDPEYKLATSVNNPIAEAERIVAGMPDKPDVKHEGARACYSPMSDIVRMPPAPLFNSSAEYYSALFHELAHATGHERRLRRDGIASVSGFGSETYSKEELVAEMGAAFLCGESGISNAVIENQAAYIGNWLRRLKDDRKLIVHAAAAGQKAADYILGRKAQERGSEVAS